MDISNGEHIGVSLFVQGCRFCCKGCFNKETWDFNGGKEWTQEVEDKFFDLINRPYIKRVSILGGEPLADGNKLVVLDLIKKIKDKYPNKSIWLYTGYTFEEISSLNNLRYIDVLVDGRYIEEQKDLTLKFRGSKNQRLIDIQKTLKENKIVLYN
jgi:anaerobic ribonucleoside-triphosphate reductase activating protein